MLPPESNHGDLLQKSLSTVTFQENSHWIQCIFHILFSSEFYSPISWHYSPILPKVQNYFHRNVWKKRLVKTHPKLTKLIDNYTHIVWSSYAKFCSERTIIHQDRGILLLDCYSGVILFICIAAKCNEMNMIWIQTRCGQLPSQSHFYAKKNMTKSNVNLKF